MVKNPLSAQQQKDALVLGFKLVNTAVSASFLKSLNKPWHSGHNPKLDVIQQKLGADLEKTIWRFKKWGEPSSCHEYLNYLADRLDIKLRKSELKGLLRTFTINDYDLVSRFIFEVSAKHHPHGQLNSCQFEFHNLVSDLKSYLLAKDSVVNGTGFESLDSIISNLLKTKPQDFFKAGYLYDLLVCDRYQMHKENNVYAIRCNKSYVSTLVIYDKNYVECDPDNYELHLVA